MKKVFFFSIALSLLSCSDVTQELNQVVALEAKVTKTETIFKSWDMNTFKEKSGRVSSRLDQVSRYYNENDLVMDMNVGLLMADFKNSGKAYKRITADYQRVKAELEYSRKQLTDMRNDLESGSMEKETAMGYLTEESQAVEALQAQVLNMETIFMKSDSLYDRYAPRVDSLIATFKAAEE